MRLLLREALLPFRRLPLLSVLSITTIAFSLFTLGLFGLIALNLRSALRGLEERVEIVAFVLRGTPPETITLAAQDVATFRARHKPDVIVRWPGKTEPTIGIEDHTQESIDFWKTFPDQKLDNQPYRVFFASGDWTCSVARFRGTMKGPMKMANGTEIPPTGKSFDLDFYTVALWDNGQIVEENLMYDLVTFLKQIGLGK